jgi:CheY-like chemotaxis protein
VLCDIGLPGMDGYAVADALRQSPETVTARLIAVTGYGREADKRRALESGFDLHLVKPVNTAQLLGHLVAVR